MHPSSARLGPWTAHRFGEGAFLLQLDHEPDLLRANALALGAARAIESAQLAGVTRVQPALDSVLVCFDPLHHSGDALQAELLRIAQAAPAWTAPHPRTIIIPTRYDGEDLPEVAKALGLSVAEVVRLHTAQPYRVLMIGFAPGFPYIGVLPPQLHIPRRATPRAAVPAGSVAIAAGLTGVYPSRLPGGWHVIGSTTVALFDPSRNPPALLQPGDWVQFVACTGEASSSDACP
ncbi:MAG: 5-oxoprolinase subunit PxpB [Thermoflexales bacterium]